MSSRPGPTGFRTGHQNSLLKKRHLSLTFAMAFPTQFQVVNGAVPLPENETKRE